MIEKRKKSKKIFYVPGMISLVLIPLVCNLYFYKSNIFDCNSVRFYDQHNEMFFKYKTIRRFKEFDFNDLKSEKSNELKELKKYIHLLGENFDTINGAKIHFDSKTEYDTFISVLSVVNKEQKTIRFFDKDDIYVISINMPPSYKSEFPVIKCGYYEVNKDFFAKNERDRKQSYMVSLYKRSWLIFLGYFGIVLINIFALVKFNKNKNYNQK